MKKFIKDNYLACIIAIVLLLVIIIFISIWIYKGTYGVDSDANITLNCPNTASRGDIIDCDINLEVTSDTIYSVKAKYTLNEEITYIDYIDTCDTCFEAYTKSENGFAVVNEEGVSTDTKIGTVRFKISDNATNGSKYYITLTEIELVNPKEDDPNDFGLISLDNVSSVVTINNEEEELDYKLDESIHVDNNTNIIYQIPVNSSYSTLLDKITTNGTITDSKGNTIDRESKIKTNDIIKIIINENAVTYTLSVIGDTNNDGNLALGDVSKLYEIYNNDENINSATKYASDLNGDGKVALGDVSALYEIYRKN